jgi:hypothetical protein
LILLLPQDEKKSGKRKMEHAMRRSSRKEKVISLLFFCLDVFSLLMLCELLWLNWPVQLA